MATPDPVKTDGNPPVVEPVRNMEDLKQAIADRDAAKAQARELQARLAGLEQREAERQAKDKESKAKAEQEALEKQGEYKKALDVAERRGAEALSTFQARAQSQLVPLAIRGAVGSIPNLADGATDDLVALLTPQLGVDPETLEVFPRGPDGKRLADEKLQPISVRSFVEKFVAGKRYLLKDVMPPTHGAGTGNGVLDPNKLGEKLDDLLKDPKALAEYASKDPDGFRKVVVSSMSSKSLRQLANERATRK